MSFLAGLPCPTRSPLRLPGSDSHRIIGLLDAKTEKAENGERIEKHLLLTRYDAARAARGEMLTNEDVLEILSTPLLGIIPESEEVLRASNFGSPITISNPSSAPARAYVDAARRLKGEVVEMTIPSAKKDLFNKLLGRRASQQEPTPLNRGDDFNAILVLDVGCARRDPGRANARDHEDHLRQDPEAVSVRSLS